MMNRQKKLSIILAGVSVVALSVALSPAFAAGTVYPAGGNPRTGATDFITIDNATIPGDYVNAGPVGGPANDTDFGIGVTNSTIAGALINDSTVSAIVTTGDSAWVTGIYATSDSVLAGGIVNNGDVEAVADLGDGTDSDIDAVAYGIDFHAADLSPGGVASADVVNALGADISASASAYASETAFAAAVGIHEYVDADALGTAIVDNAGSISATANARAESDTGDAYAAAYATGVAQDVYAEHAEAIVLNEGTITARAAALASTSDLYAEAEAIAGAIGIDQTVNDDEFALASVTNGLADVIEAEAVANATSLAGGAFALASATGLAQDVNGADVRAELLNDGSVTASADANANGYDYAYAYAYAVGVEQDAHGNFGDATVLADNSGDISAVATADAISETDDAEAEADATGLDQYAYASFGNAAATLTNAGSLTASAVANATGYTSADADAAAVGADQYVGTFIGNATVLTENIGTISANATAKAFSTTGEASADATATGLTQETFADLGDAITTLTNDGTLTAAAAAQATGYTSADASATATGVNQYAFAYGGDATITATNSGVISGFADADALSATGEAEADANASGLYQYAYAYVGDATVGLTNTSTISALATADANGDTSADASASATAVYQYARTYGGDVTVTASNSGVISAVADANAFSANGEADEAEADAEGLDQNARSIWGDASVALDNLGSITASAMADATGYTSADAEASATGVDQYVDAYGGDAAIIANNASIISAAADANAFSGAGEAEADAEASGLYQYAFAYVGDVSVAMDNLGSITASAMANATGYTSADASASATAVDQGARSRLGDATLTATNSGVISAVADANALSADGNAEADASATALDQYASAYLGDVAVSLNNTGSIAASAAADATGYDYAYADAYAMGVDQYADADGGDATVSASGGSSISAVAAANAVSEDSDARAEASATGLDQHAYAYLGDANVTLDNLGSITVSAGADANGYDDAYAYAYAMGVRQYAAAYGDAAVIASNADVISAVASANAVSLDSSADAYATATGLHQDVEGYTALAALNNTGEISAVATAFASAPEDEYAQAIARGHVIEENAQAQAMLPSLGDLLTLDVNNAAGASITAFALADAETANARAAGAWYSAGELEGTIVNAGLISGSAIASGTTGTASAFGVAEISDGPNNTWLTNTGLILAYAEGPTARATGVAVASFNYPERDQVAPGAVGLTTITNDGGAIAAGVVDTSTEPMGTAAVLNGDGVPISRGSAINTRGFTTFEGIEYGAAPNPVLIELQGGVAGSAGKAFAIENGFVSTEVQAALSGYDSWGFIFGNIEITEDDVVDVTDGVTVLDGVINSDGALIGELNIFDDGKLVMVQNTVDGPAGANVAAFNIDSSGTLVYELTPDTTDGAYPRITAIDADITGGNFVALYDAGIYADSFVYEDVIDADNLVGTFGTVEDNSALLVTQAVYDANDNVDLVVDRVAFDEVGGMTRNQRAVGGAIENVYAGLDGSTDFGRLVGSLFTLDDGDYQRFLDQLTGAEYAQHLQSVLWSTRAINRIITERMECDGGAAYTQTSAAKIGNNTVMPTADAPMASTGCFEPGQASVWMRGFGQWNNLDGDSNAPGYDETQYGILFGGDYAFDENWFLGIAGGYFNSEGDFDSWGGRDGASIDYDGLQLAAYGGYDNSVYYLRGVVSYGNYDGESHRLIALNGSPIDPSGDPSSDTWSFYGETGYRFGITDSANLTPFAGLSLATASMDGFTEDDPEGTGAALEVHDADADSVASVLGVRFDADMAMGSGVFTPVVSVAWMHEFGDTAQEVDMSFAGAPAGADFTVKGSEVARDSVLVDAGAKFALDGNFDFGLFYNGQFNEDYNSNAVTARLGYKF